ncbi:MAG TPA: redoxin domain-containing protein [Abditibacteriaceae bacterium]|jgi:thiol-disulfide isomerase/thioredoxin
MLKKYLLSALIALGFLHSAVPAEAAPKQTQSETEKAICAVCGPREGAHFEEVKARATLKGREYVFCATGCKIEFLKNPTEFLETGEGKPAPAFTLRDLKKKSVSLNDFKGRVLLIDFWGTWCKPCVAALPQLQKWHQELQGRGLTVLGLAIDEDPKLVARTTTKVTYPQLLATSKVWQDYKISTLPALVLVGRDGKVVQRFGAKSEHKDIQAAIEKELAKPAPR